MKSIVAAVCLLLAAGYAHATGEAVAAADFQRAVAHVTTLVEASRGVEGASPAIAVVFVRDGAEPVLLVDGIADARIGTPADADTAFYIASMTKSYVGLLAAKLDATGVLPLETTLETHWPALRMHEGIPGGITLRQLLGHRAPVENGTLSFRTSFTDAVPTADYPHLLGAYSELREPGFRYDNLGYVTWAAVLEAKTGRSWHEWLASEILSPLGLSGTASDPAKVDGVVARPHQWTGSGWSVTEGKPRALMHAAGGLLVTPADMARWLQVHLAGEAPDVPSRVFDAAHAVEPYPEAPNEGLACDGYALGWRRCHAAGYALLDHGGGYDGFRSRMVMVPEHGVGIAVLTNTDAMTGALSTALIREFLVALSPSHAASVSATVPFVETYRDNIRRHLQSRQAAMDARKAEPDWEGWAWRPDRAALGEYEGDYTNDRLGRMRIVVTDRLLRARLGEMVFELLPARPDLFGGSAGVFDAHDRFAFERDAGGRVTGVSWGGRAFARE